MTVEVLFDLVAVAFWLFMAGFFSGAETGMYALNRFRLSARAADGDPSALRLQKLLSRPAELIITLLVGTNLSIYVATATSTNLVSRSIPWSRHMLPAIITTLVMSPLVLLFAEMIPKEIFRRRPWRLPYTTSRAVRIFALVFKLPAMLLKTFVILIERTLGMNGEKADPFFSRQQLADLIAVGVHEGVISPYQADMARKAMKLGSVTLAQVMIPLAQVAMVEKSASVDTFLSMAKQRRHSRIPVFEKARTNVVGLVNIFDVYYHPGQGDRVADYVEEVIRLRADSSVSHALPVLQHQKRVMALVVDADDAPTGIVTIKDIVEEIAGDLADW